MKNSLRHDRLAHLALLAALLGTDRAAARALIPCLGDPWLAVQDSQLVANDAAPGQDGFGTSVAMSGTTVTIGAPKDAPAGVASGSACVFVKSAGTWTQQAKLVGSDVLDGDEFGHAVAIFGDTIVVGARYHSNGSLSFAGAVYVFVRSGTNWTQQAILTPSDPHAFDKFGQAVAIQGDTIAVSSDAPFGPFGPSGAIYIFERTAGSWTQHEKLTAGADRLGECLAFQGDTIVAGSPEDSEPFNANFTNVGSADVFVRIGSSWFHQATLLPRDPDVGLAFGASVAVFGDTIAVGAPDRRSQRGEAYVFVRVGNAWEVRQKFHSAIWPHFSEFGSSVALHQDTLIVGAWLTDVPPPNHSSGAAYVFQHENQAWREHAKLVPADLPAPGYLGISAAFEGNEILLGAARASLEGAAYVFRLEPSNTFCFGDGSLATACPCAAPNFVPVPSGGPESGCANAFDLSGAHLDIGGLVSPDTLMFRADIGAGYGGFAFLVKGDGRNTAGIANDDGIRCVDGALLRFGGHNAGAFGDGAGSWIYPNSAQTTAVSAATNQTPAQSAYYQVIYRHAAANFCSPGTTNWTNAVQVDW